MKHRSLAAFAAFAILVSACGSSGTPVPASAAASPSAAAPASAAASASAAAPASAAASPSAAGFDVNSISGPVVLSGWQSSPAEGNALTQALLSFQATYPNVKVDYEPIAGDYPTVMAAEVRRARRAGPLLRQRGLRPGVDRPERSCSARRLHLQVGLRHERSSSPGTPTSSRAPTGRPTASPRTATPSRWPTTRTWFPPRPRRWTTLVTLAHRASRARDGLKAPLCLNPSLDRGLAFLYAQGGSLLSSDGKAAAIDTGRRPRRRSSGTWTCSRTAWA